LAFRPLRGPLLNPLEGGDQQLHRCLHPSIHDHGFRELEGCSACGKTNTAAP
jgi:hypothetical protein